MSEARSSPRQECRFGSLFAQSAGLAGGQTIALVLLIVTRLRGKNYTYEPPSAKGRPRLPGESFFYDFQVLRQVRRWIVKSPNCV